MFPRDFCTGVFLCLRVFGAARFSSTCFCRLRDLWPAWKSAAPERWSQDLSHDTNVTSELVNHFPVCVSIVYDLPVLVHQAKGPGRVPNNLDWIVGDLSFYLWFVFQGVYDATASRASSRMSGHSGYGMMANPASSAAGGGGVPSMNDGYYAVSGKSLSSTRPYHLSRFYCLTMIPLKHRGFFKTRRGVIISRTHSTKRAVNERFELFRTVQNLVWWKRGKLSREWLIPLSENRKKKYSESSKKPRLFMFLSNLKWFYHKGDNHLLIFYVLSRDCSSNFSHKYKLGNFWEYFKGLRKRPIWVHLLHKRLYG
jgi:hypothetical protein